jgi:hypothetical protein
MSDEPVWLDWVEPEVADLTDVQLQEYVAEWSSEAKRYRRQRHGVTLEHPDAYRVAYSAWWCSKWESFGLREQQRRQIRRARDGA